MELLKSATEMKARQIKNLIGTCSLTLNCLKKARWQINQISSAVLESDSAVKWFLLSQANEATDQSQS